MNGNEKCDDYTDDDTDWQHDPYVSAMLRRWHKKYQYHEKSIFKR